MKYFTYLTLMIALALFAVGQTAYGAVWESCGQWANWEDGGYILYNNIWGGGAGEQCIWANSYHEWGVWADHPDIPDVKSYPNSGLDDINASISELAYLTSTFNCTVPSAGNYCTSYDVWSGRKYEIMLWMNKHGAVGPWADDYDEYGNPIPKVSNLDLGGHTWDFYYNGGGRMHVYSFIRTTNTNSGTVDILAVLQYLLNNGWCSDLAMDKVQLGFEITASPGGLDFTMNDFSVSYGTTGTSPPAAPSDLTATVASATAVDLAWTDNASNEEGFRIERSLTSGSGFSEIATVGANVNTYPDTGLTTGTTYYYRVCAFNASGDSDYSNEADATPMPLGDGTGLKGDYYDNGDLTNLIMTRTDATVNFDWGTGSPDPAIDPDSFSVRWTGEVQPLFSETYTFYTYADDGTRLWVNGQLILDNWKTQSATEVASSPIALTAGTKYTIKLEYFENSGGAVCKLLWSSASQMKEIIPQTQLYEETGGTTTTTTSETTTTTTSDCLPKGALCTSDDECCSGTCAGIKCK